MTRIAILTFVFLITALPVLADEYGDRFSNTAPSALGDFTAPSDDLIAQGISPEDLNNMAPAAGDEQPLDLPPVTIQNEQEEIEEGQDL